MRFVAQFCRQASILALFSIGIVACVPMPKVDDISLLSKTHPVQHDIDKRQQRLTVVVSKKLTHPENIGGDDYFRHTRFHDITPWLEGRLQALNDLPCSLKKKLKLFVTINKLYSTMDSEVTVGTLALKIDYLSEKGQQYSQLYRGECKSSFFALNKADSLQSCFNEVFAEIASEIKNDICHRPG